MDIRFSAHNTHHEDPASFRDRDPHLRQLQKQTWVHRSQLLTQLPYNQPGIYTIGGGRQVGKTTLVKQWMVFLLENGIAPDCIVYLTGELINDHHSLVMLITTSINEMSEMDLKYIFLDEVTYIRHWDKGVKYLADAGILENVIMILTGSDLAIIKEARMRFPGRRGNARPVDFHLYPLNFLETVQLKKHFSQEKLNQLLNTEIEPADNSIVKLFEAFGEYLIHGGFLTAINDFARYEKILPSTLATYSDWIRGDVLKRGKQEHYLREILSAIIKRYGSQVTWNALARDLSIDHPQTVSDYIALLATMDAVFVQPALIEEKLTAAPKKARKLMFSDPFIFHAITAWLNSEGDPYRRQITPLLSDPDRSARIVEACVATHYQRYFPTYYIKAKGEVDIAYVDQRRFWPLEIKWSGQIRSKDLKQVAKYRNSRILSKLPQFGNICGVPVEPLPLALLRLCTGSTKLL